MKYFLINKYIFQLNTPQYEVPVFGYKIGELRRVHDLSAEHILDESLTIDKLGSYLKNEDIKICTYRGHEEIDVIRMLMNNEFLFVGSYVDVICKIENFKKLNCNKSFGFSKLSSQEYNEILNIEAKVFDFSTFQIDPLIDPKTSSKRNNRRVKSYFNNPGHVIYVLRIKNKIVGFLQFVIDKKIKEANCVNGAIHPEFQKTALGPILYSKSFDTVFSEDIKLIKSGFSNQNKAMANIFYAFNFSPNNIEIHLRRYL